MRLNVRGGTSLSARPIAIGAATMVGRKPAIVVYVKSASKRLYEEFLTFCDSHGVYLTPLTDPRDDGRVDQFEAIGMPEVLIRLAGLSCVQDYHCLLNVGVPRFAVTLDVHSPGPRDAAAAVRRELARRKLSRKDRLAAEVREERRLLTQEERDTIALNEVAEFPH